MSTYTKNKLDKKMKKLLKKLTKTINYWENIENTQTNAIGSSIQIKSVLKDLGFIK